MALASAPRLAAASARRFLAAPSRAALAAARRQPQAIRAMSGLTGALAEFHDLEFKNWQKAPAAYNKGWGSLTSQCIPAVLASVGCAPGVRLLDVATGPGFVAEAAAKQGAEVVALDFSAKMLDLARERLKAEGVLGSEVGLSMSSGPFSAPPGSRSPAAR